RQVDTYIALSEFARRKCVDGGLPGDRVVVKPNFVSPDPGVGKGQGGYALFVGRLWEEKRLRTLAAAWRTAAALPLRRLGDGTVNNTAWPEGVAWLGAQ